MIVICHIIPTGKYSYSSCTNIESDSDLQALDAAGSNDPFRRHKLLWDPSEHFVNPVSGSFCEGSNDEQASGDLLLDTKEQSTEA